MKLSGMMLGVTLAAMLSTSPASAACWTDSEVSAARVRDMDTMLMVSALRCKANSNSLLADYNQFVRTSRVALTQVNDRLREHFSAAVGPAQALNAYDRYVTGIANRYGAGAEGLGCRDMASIVSAARAEGGNLTGLERLARDAGVEPQLGGGRCERTIARR
jgi:hypothetical protein